MTLAEFRFLTYNLDPNTELEIYHASGYSKVNTFEAHGGALVLANGQFDSSNGEGVVRAIAKLKKR